MSKFVSLPVRPVNKLFPSSILLNPNYNSRAFTSKSSSNKSLRHNSQSNDRQFLSNPFSSFFSAPQDFNSIFNEFNKLANNMMQLNNAMYNQFFRNERNEENKEQQQQEQGKHKSDREIEIAGDSSISGINPIDSSINLMNTKELRLKLDLDENENEYVIKASTPEFSKDNLHCEVRDGYLLISGEQNEEKQDNKTHYKSSRSVSQSIKLPNNIKEDQIQAKFENGVLNIIVPKLHKDKNPSQTPSSNTQTSNINSTTQQGKTAM